MTEEVEERQRYRELLEEFRTIIPGVQLLFAFLLAVPFTARFSEVDDTGRVIFIISLVGVAAATVLFLAPTSYHRIVGHTGREARLRFGIVTAMAGMVLLAISMTCAVFVVVRFLMGWPLAAIVSGAIAGLVILAWYLIPVRHRR